MRNLLFFDLMPDPEFYQTTSFWVLIIAVIAAIAGLVIWFIRKKKKQ